MRLVRASAAAADTAGARLKIIILLPGDDLLITRKHCVYHDHEPRRAPRAGYLDEACSQNLGFKGIFRIRVGRPGQEPELLEGTRHHRPNGIAFSPDFSHLYVSDCCQGSHMSNCTQGDAVYTVYRVQEDGGLSFERSIRFRVEGEAGSRGCADGFKVDPRTGHIVASCPMGICIVGTGVPLEPAGGAAPGLGGFQGADFDDDGDDFEPTRQPEEDLLPPDAADADADADAALGEAGSGTVEEEVAEETYESVEADDVAEGGKEDQVGDLAEEMVAEDDEELQQQEEEYVQMEAKEEELEEEEEEEQQREEEEDVEGKEEEQRAEKEEKEEKHEEEANEEQQQDEEDKQQEDASDPYSNEELAAAAEEEEEEEEEEGHNEELEQEEQEEASGPDSSEELAAAAAVDEEVANEELEQEEQEASGPDSTENLAAADEEGVEEEEPEQLKNEEPVQEEQEASGQDSTQAASAADEDGEEEEPEQLKNEEPVQEEQEASGQDSTQAAAAAAAPAEDELQREMADDADDGQEAQEEAIRHEDASSASRGVTNERLPQQKSEAESESGRGGGGNLPSGARTAAQAHRMRTQKASARRLLMSSSGGGEAGDADDEVIGLLARLHLGHRVSNVVFGNDGFLYATGESKHGGGALMRIALRHYPTAAGGSHDELRRRRQL